MIIIENQFYRPEWELFGVPKLDLLKMKVLDMAQKKWRRGGFPRRVPASEVSEKGRALIFAIFAFRPAHLL